MDNRPELFEGATESISEVGGFSVTLADDARAYLVETAEKGVVWLRLQVRGTAGHASMLNDDNPVAKLASAVTRLAEHRFPLILTEPVRDFLAGVADLDFTALFHGVDERVPVDALEFGARVLDRFLRAC